jgi:toxin ParE1/3/4
MAQIIWTNHALADLNEIGEYIAKDSGKYAALTVQKIYKKVSFLQTHPKAGRIVPEIDQEYLRELIEGNYRIIHELTGETISILTVHHSSRQLRL